MKKLKPTSKDDNVLLEYETALSLKDRKRIAILPLLKGQTEQTEFNFGSYAGWQFPATASPTDAKGSIAHTITSLLLCQGLKLNDYDWLESGGALPDDLIDRIVDTLANVAWGADKRKGQRLTFLRRRKSVSSALETNVAEPDVDCLHLYRYWRGNTGIDKNFSLNVSNDNRDDLPATEGVDLHTTTFPPVSAWATQVANGSIFSGNPLFELDSTETDRAAVSIGQHARAFEEEFGAWEESAKDTTAEGRSKTASRSRPPLVLEKRHAVQLSSFVASSATDALEDASGGVFEHKISPSASSYSIVEERSEHSALLVPQEQAPSSRGRAEYVSMRPLDLVAKSQEDHISIVAGTTTDSCPSVNMPPTPALPVPLRPRYPTIGPSSSWMAPPDMMEREQVEHILCDREDGTFVVRNKSKGRYALSTIQGGVMRHDMLIWDDDKGWSLTGRRLVPAARGSLEELLDRLASQDALQVLKTPLVRGAFAEAEQSEL